MKKKNKDEFKVIYIDEEEIVLEEDKRKLKPFMLFFFKYGRLITMLFASIAILTFIGGIALSISSIPRITKPEETKIPATVMEFDGTDNKVRTNSGTPITKEYAEQLFNNNGKNSEKSYKITNIITIGDDKVIYFNNGSAVIIYGDKSKLPIYVPNSNNVSTKNNKIEVTGPTVNTTKKIILPDGMIVYEFANDKLMTELNDDYKLYDKNKGNPIDIIKQGNDKIVYFDNGSAVIVYNDANKMPDYIDNMENVKIENNNIVVTGDKIPATNKKTLPDGTTIYEFPNDKIMSESKDKENYKLYDKDKVIYDKDGNIVDNSNSNQGNTTINPIKEEKIGNDKILYFDNGSAVIIYGDKSKNPIYVPNKDNVTTDGNSININGAKVQTIDKKVLPDGTIIYEFANDKALIEKDDEYKLINKNDLEYDDKGNLKDDDESEILIKNFNIKNNSDEKLKYRIVIEETEDYNKYNKQKLLPQYIYQKVSINGNDQQSKLLNSDTWEKGSKLEDNTKIQNNTYIMYEGEIEPKSAEQLKVAFWVDYESITNDMQDKWFIGTIKLYSWQ